MFIDLPLTQSQAREPFDIADLTCLLVCAGQVVVGTIRLTVINICIEYPELSVYIGNNPLSLSLQIYVLPQLGWVWPLLSPAAPSPETSPPLRPSSSCC